MQDWDEGALSYAATRQRCERFTAQGCITPGEVLRIGAREWQVLAAPGHDPESLMLFDAEHGVLISADALWGNGFGVVFPELDGEPGFDDVGRVLDLIESLPLRCVIPGHGPAFGDVAAALQRARERLAAFKADPARHLRHGVKVLLKYHLMEEQSQPLAELREWMRDVPLLRSVWLALGEGVLMLERSLRPPGANEGSAHVLVLACADLEAAARGLAAAGLEIVARTTFTLYFHDPDGHRVGLSAYRFG